MQRKTFSMSLSELFAELLPEAQLPERSGRLEVRGLNSDSRTLQPGDIYLALVGAEYDGKDFIADAIARGAIAVVLDSADHAAGEWPGLSVPVLEVHNLSDALPALAARFYRQPSQSMHVMGVTGTNGKTTCSWLLAAALAKLAGCAGLIGTLGWGVFARRDSDSGSENGSENGTELESTGLTTPGAVLLQRCLASLQQAGCDYVAMEVSSHALSQARVASVGFTTAIFTNLSRDHLDFHGDMQAYAEAKRALFEKPGLQNAILNRDDPFGRAWATTLSADVRTLTYAVSDSFADIHAREVRFAMHGIEAEVTTPWGNGQLRIHLIGEFNLSNSLAVLAAICTAGFTLQDALAALAAIEPVPGRMQLVDLQAAAESGEDITVVVDYAHTPDALALALQALRPHTPAGLCVVFGAGGDRDSGKRPLMGAAAERHADSVILTSDNPRGERTANIVADICAGMRAPQAAHIELDRGEAIAHAIATAASGDIVLIAGKGHEDYQIVGDDRLPFSDCSVARRELQRRFAA